MPSGEKGGLDFLYPGQTDRAAADDQDRDVLHVFSVRLEGMRVLRVHGSIRCCSTTIEPFRHNHCRKYHQKHQYAQLVPMSGIVSG